MPVSKCLFGYGQDICKVALDFLESTGAGAPCHRTIASRRGARSTREVAAVTGKTRLIFSLAAGLAATLVAAFALSGARAEAGQARREALERYGGELTAACVATRDIEPGEEIDEGNVGVEEWVSGLLPERACTSLRDVVGKVATSRIPGRTVLSETHFERDEGSVEVPSGKVAVSVAADAQRALGGALGRGETVDVYASDDVRADRVCEATVLDTSALADGGGSIEWVTLAVDERSVSEVLTASGKGLISLALPGAWERDEGEGS